MISSLISSIGTIRIPRASVKNAIIIASGGLSGGISSAIAGGNFWQGARQGLITSGLNHVAHLGYKAVQGKPKINPFGRMMLERAYNNRSDGLTLATPVGIVAVLGGVRFTFLKPLAALGSKPGSSLISYGLGKTFTGNIYNSFGRNRVTSYLTRRTGTAVTGRVAGRILSRFIPYVGWGLLAYDGVNYVNASYHDLQFMNNYPNLWYLEHRHAIEWAQSYGERE